VCYNKVNPKSRKKVEKNFRKGLSKCLSQFPISRGANKKAFQKLEN
jgi:hypothetical protein